MTYYKSESAVAGPNQQKLIIEVWTTPDVGAIAWNTNSVSIRVKASTHQNLYSGDNQTFNRTGNWHGSTTYYMPATPDATVVIADQTYNVSPQQGRTTTVNYGGNITGHYSGASFSTNVQVVIAAKPYPASKPTLSASSFDMGTTVTINTNRINSGFTHIVKYKFNAASGTIATNVGASTTWAFPIATLAPQIPTTTQGSGTITLDTYNGGTLVGTDSVTFIAKLPTSVVPTITTVNASEANTAVASGVGAYVKTLTNLRVQLTGCSAPYGASITKHEVVVQNYAYDLTNLSNGGVSSTNTVLSRKLDAAGTVAVVGKVTDSRGRAYQNTLNITVLDYALPNPTELTVQRCDSAGTVNTLGTYAKVTSKGTISSLIVESTQKNELQYKLEYRLTNAPTWTVLKTTTAVAGVSLNSTETLGGGNISPTSAYEFRLTVYDKFNNVGITTRIGTSEVTLSLNKTGVGIGKVWQQGSIDANGEIFQGGVTIPPSGAVVAFAAASAPIGWLLCNGSAVSRTTYARLFAVIGTSFGVGDNSTTFNLPNLKGRVIAGLDSAQSEFNTLGEIGGTKSETLTTQQMPSHGHGPPSGYFYVESTNGAMRRSTVINYVGTAGENDIWRQRLAENSGDVPLPTASAGGDQSHNNLQPYIAMNYIIKT